MGSATRRGAYTYCSSLCPCGTKAEGVGVPQRIGEEWMCIIQLFSALVQEYSPEIDKRYRPHLRITNDSWRVDETYIEVKGKPKYLYRAVDFQGNTLDFLLSAKRDALVAKRLFRKTLRFLRIQTPRVITVDKNPADSKAIKELKAAKKLPEEVKLRQSKYLNNIVEQDHRGIKRLVKPTMGFGSFNTAQRTIRGYEIINMMRKRQVLRVPKGGVKERVFFINRIFGVVA